MNARASLWHTPLALCALLAGCYESHSRGLVPPTPTEPPPVLDAGLRDAPPAPHPDAALNVDGVCAEIFAALRDGVAPADIACDGRGFPRDCVEAVSECCQVHATCEPGAGDGGHVVTSLSCDDSCDQACATYAGRDCVLVSHCEWMNTMGCDARPPSCIDRRERECTTDAECPLGEACRSWSVPCPAGACDACIEERFCAR